MNCPGGRVTPEVAINRMRAAHNLEYTPIKRWSYGLDYERGICAAASHKSPDRNSRSPPSKSRPSAGRLQNQQHYA